RAARTGTVRLSAAAGPRSRHGRGDTAGHAVGGMALGWRVRGTVDRADVAVRNRTAPGPQPAAWQTPGVGEPRRSPRGRLGRTGTGSRDPRGRRTGGDRRGNEPYLAAARRSPGTGLCRRHGLCGDRNGARRAGGNRQEPRLTRENRAGGGVGGAAMTHDAATHGRVWEMLAGYVAGTVSPDEHTAIAAHLDTCAACRDELAAWQAVRGGTRQAAPTDAAPGGAIVRTVLARAQH